MEPATAGLVYRDDDAVEPGEYRAMFALIGRRPIDAGDDAVVAAQLHAEGVRLETGFGLIENQIAVLAHEFGYPRPLRERPPGVQRLPEQRAQRRGDLLHA